MNLLYKVIAFSPALFAYLKGGMEFNSGNFETAIKYFEKCIKHPNFKNELVYSHLGQALCAIGQLNEAYIYLQKACDFYEAADWKLKDQHEVKLAQGTLSALRHISKYTNINVSSKILGKTLEDCPTSK